MTPRTHALRAQSMLEFAMVLPVFMLLLLGLIDFSRLLFTYISVANGAREVARSVTITSNNMTTVANAFNNLTLFGGSTSSATSVTFAPPGGGSGSVLCNGAADAMCTLQVTTGPSTSPTCASGTVCLQPATSTTGSSGSASYSSTSFNYDFNPSITSGTTGTDYVVLTWLTAQSGSQQGYIQVCRLPFTNNCVFPAGLPDRRANTDGYIQVDLKYVFQFNPLFQNRLAGIVDVSFLRPSAAVTTSVRTYSE